MNHGCVLLVVLWLLGAGGAAGHAIQGVFVNSEGPFTCSAETLDEVGDFCLFRALRRKDCDALKQVWLDQQQEGPGGLEERCSIEKDARSEERRCYCKSTDGGAATVHEIRLPLRLPFVHVVPRPAPQQGNQRNVRAAFIPFPSSPIRPSVREYNKLIVIYLHRNITII